MEEALPIPVSIIGYGLSAKIFHIPFIQALPHLYTLHSIVQRHPSPANSAPADHPTLTHYTSTAAMLADPTPRLVVITTPPSTHEGLCTAALNSAKHVLVEKPFVPSSTAALALASLAASRGLTLAVYHNRRCDADYLTLRALLSSRRLGRLTTLTSHFDRHRPAPSASSAAWKLAPAPGNGALYDLGTHLLDQFVALFGLPARVTAFVTDQRQGADPAAGGDSFLVHCHYDAPAPGAEVDAEAATGAGGGPGFLATASAAVVGPARHHLRFWARGTAAAFVKRGMDPQEDQLRAGLRPGEQGYGVEEEEVAGGTVTEVVEGDVRETTAQVPEGASYVKFYEALAAAVAGQGAVPVSAEDGAKVIRLIELAMESSTLGRTVEVTMP